MAIIDRTPPMEPPAEPAQRARAAVPAPAVSDTAAVHSTALAWTKLVLYTLGVALGVVIGLMGPMELGIALLAGLGGAGLRIIINVRR
ncbi:hypothetical protein [Streptomyces sp. NPDC000351]|uniref:hypothetical protein n=1 Tax=Streptomyces sp. NPDC000351 TaxID=3154250 RepID=UPI003324BDD8